MKSLNGKPINTDYGRAVVIEYDQCKEKFKVEYDNQHAIGWLSEREFSLADQG